MWVCWILRTVNAGLSDRGQHISQRCDETGSILTLTKRTHAPHRVEQLHMDTKNESRGVREERVGETHTLQVDAPMTDKCHSAPGLGHERQMIPSSAIERPHGDAGRGEFDLGGCRGGDL